MTWFIWTGIASLIFTAIYGIHNIKIKNTAGVFGTLFCMTLVILGIFVVNSL
ncbi:MAG: hypothetical protein IJA35_07390 [Clostridia bacterium]|nr:hypothetical protein [Clostridia bacterium]